MIGVTGTQGKTTVTRLLDGGLGAAGITSAVVGTVGTRIAGTDLKTALTTPEAPDLHGLFALMREQGVACCAIEVSSHALVLGRVDGVVFDVAVFTNLGRDHLDFHADVDDYFAAKATLFTPGRARLGLVNIDDELRPSAGRHDRDHPGAHDVHARSRCRLVGGRRRPRTGRVDVHDPRAGRPVAAGVGRAARRLQRRQRAVGRRRGGRGRARSRGRGRRDRGRPGECRAGWSGSPTTGRPASRSTSTTRTSRTRSRRCSATLRPVTAGRLIVVIGAGGDRDRGKRPVMGAIAAADADLRDRDRRQPAHRGSRRRSGRRCWRAWTTSRPPGRAEVREIGDRRAAIAAALEAAGPGDVVLIAGKGHETGQEVAGVVHPFDDREVVRELLRGDRPMIPMRLDEIAAVVGGDVHGDPAVLVTGAAYVDNRSPVPAGLFVAIVGERVDGHEYAAGAHAVLGSRPTDAPTVVVADPVVALGRLARHVVDRTPATVLALTGSGRQDRHQGLPGRRAPAPRRRRARVVATEGNGNNEIGVPLTVLRAGAATDYLVVEMGARGDRPHRLPVRHRTAADRRGPQRRHRARRRVRRPRADRAGQGRDRRGAARRRRGGAQRRRPAGGRDGVADAGTGA